jgi:glutamate racemase
MKIKVDYNELRSAIEKFNKDLQLDVSEKKALVQLIEASEGDYYPSKEEYELQSNTVKQLDNVDPDKQPELYDRLLDTCTVYENKYC